MYKYYYKMPNETNITLQRNDDNSLRDFIEIFQDCNINFLIGSGLSNPFLGTLGKIEEWLTDLENKQNLDKNLKDFVKASLYASYFSIAIKDNIDIYKFSESEVDNIILDDPKHKLKNTYLAYKNFLGLLNQILYRRNGNVVNKQVNLFTTNIDIFLEKIIDDLELNYNDGFNGIFKKRYNLSNFRKSSYQKSPHYDNISEIPIFNLIKLHGSISWKLEKTNIYLVNLKLIYKIINIIKKRQLINIKDLTNNKENLSVDDIIEEAKKEEYKNVSFKRFIKEYEKLQIINPTKEKFKNTTFNKTYYEMMRFYANQLEKENSVLIIHGFSMADEHIREITFRSIKSNPTLKVFICSYLKNADLILKNLKDDNIDLNNFHNVQLINPKDKFDLNSFNDLILTPICNTINS